MQFQVGKKPGIYCRINKSMEIYDHSLEIELTSKCTLQCPACSRMTSTDRVWDAGDMDINVIKRICDGTNYHRYLFVGCYGDVIYHPNFVEICKYYQDAGKKLLVHTNGSLKPQKFWDQMAELDWSKTWFTFSIDGLEDTNHNYRVNAKWDSIMRGVDAMRNIPKERFPAKLIWKYLVFPYNEHQVEAAEAMAMKLGFTDFEALKSLRDATTYYEKGNGDKFVWKS
jgi:MoaA/NifB/PqqE/SkfB family radical SAM enzyme